MTFFLISALLLPASQAFSQDPAETETVVERSKHEVIVANTLWDLAAHYYNDPWQWTRIHEANLDSIKDPHWIYPGQVLVIPGLDKTVTIIKKQAPETAPEAVRVEEQPEPQETKAEGEPVAPVPVPAGEFKSYEALGADVLPDSLSSELPRGMSGQQPSAFRLRVPQTWKADGEVAVFLDHEGLAAAGDSVKLRIDESVQVRKRQRFGIYRRASPTDADGQGAGAGAQFLQKVGILEVEKKLSQKEYRGVIVQSGGEVQVGDLVKREE